MRIRAETGDFGPGDPQLFLQERIQGYFENLTPAVLPRVLIGARTLGQAVAHRLNLRGLLLPTHSVNRFRTARMISALNVTP